MVCENGNAMRMQQQQLCKCMHISTHIMYYGIQSRIIRNQVIRWTLNFISQSAGDISVFGVRSGYGWGVVGSTGTVELGSRYAQVCIWIYLVGLRGSNHEPPMPRLCYNLNQTVHQPWYCRIPNSQFCLYEFTVSILVFLFNCTVLKVKSRDHS